MPVPSKSTSQRALTFWVLVIAVCAYPISAQQPITNTLAAWFDRATLTGDWGGARTTLEDAGIELRAGFTTESAANPAGGLRQAVRYTQEVDFGADLDLSRLIGDPGARGPDYVH